jgi:hypothetical protein
MTLNLAGGLAEIKLRGKHLELHTSGLLKLSPEDAWTLARSLIDVADKTVEL